MEKFQDEAERAALFPRWGRGWVRDFKLSDSLRCENLTYVNAAFWKVVLT
jgi:hypothetical protein